MVSVFHVLTLCVCVHAGSFAGSFAGVQSRQLSQVGNQQLVIYCTSNGVFADAFQLANGFRLVAALTALNRAMTAWVIKSIFLHAPAINKQDTTNNIVT